MKQFVLFIIIFVIVYLFYLLFVISRKKSLEKWKSGKEMTYLKYRYKLNLDKINIKELANVIGLSNALIMSLVVTVISFFKSFVIQMLVGIVLLFPSIIIIYHIIGKYYQRKQRRKK